MYKKHFTLIELLIVVSIITILFALLLPSLQRSKMKARQVLCLSNGRQWATAIVMITKDKDGVIPEMPDELHMQIKFCSNKTQGSPTTPICAFHSLLDIPNQGSITIE